MFLPPLFLNLCVFSPDGSVHGIGGRDQAAAASGVDKENPAIAEAAVGRTIEQRKSCATLGAAAGSFRLWPRPRGER
jgi:hypothetical protein